MAKPSTRQMWAMKLAGTLPDKSGGVNPASLRPKKVLEGVFLGIDPSLRGTGLSVVQSKGNAYRLLISRTLKMPAKAPMSQCLAEIFRSVSDYIEEYQVDEVAMEQTIFVQNYQTAQILGAARGAAMSAAGVLERTVSEYAPLRIKQAVVGYGRASKQQVAGMVRQILGMNASLPFDEADAAGVALCHIMTAGS